MIDEIPESMKLNFEEVNNTTHVARFPFGEWMIVGPNRQLEYGLGFVIYHPNNEHATYSLEDKPKTLRAAKYVAQRFHIDNVIPKIVEMFEPAKEESCPLIILP